MTRRADLVGNRMLIGKQARGIEPTLLAPEQNCPSTVLDAAERSLLVGLPALLLQRATDRLAVQFQLPRDRPNGSALGPQREFAKWSMAHARVTSAACSRTFLTDGLATPTCACALRNAPVASTRERPFSAPVAI